MAESNDTNSEHGGDRVAVVCAHCGQAYRVARRLMGRRLRCKHCKKQWRAKEVPVDELSQYRKRAADGEQDSGQVGLRSEDAISGSSTSAIDMGWVGKTLGRYEAKSLLGHGGMGVVWRAHDDSLRRDVALKILTRSREESAKAGLNLDLFMQEARAVAQLQYPSVVSIYEVDEDQGHVFLALELMEGGTLKEYVDKHGPIEPRKLFEWLIGPVKALSLAHRRNIIHRDIKPSNLMFDEHDHMKLMDFGLADVAGEEVSERLRGKAVGSLGWIAPETANGRDTTAQSDLYSLGLVMYFALTGKSMIRGKTRSKVIAAHRTPPAPDLAKLKHLTPKCRAILERCLAVDPKDRYQSADALLVDLEDCASFDPVARRQQRKTTLMIVAISAVTSAVIGVGVVLYVMIDLLNQQRQAREPVITATQPVSDQG